MFGRTEHLVAVASVQALREVTSSAQKVVVGLGATVGAVASSLPRRADVEFVGAAGQGKPRWSVRTRSRRTSGITGVSDGDRSRLSFMPPAECSRARGDRPGDHVRVLRTDRWSGRDRRGISRSAVDRRFPGPRGIGRGGAASNPGSAQSHVFSGVSRRSKSRILTPCWGSHSGSLRVGVPPHVLIHPTMTSWHRPVN